MTQFVRGSQTERLKLATKLAFDARRRVKEGDLSVFLLPLIVAIVKDGLVDPISDIPIVGQVLDILLSFPIAVYLFIFMWGRGKWKMRVLFFFISLLDILPFIDLIPFTTACVLYARHLAKKEADAARDELAKLDATMKGLSRKEQIELQRARMVAQQKVAMQTEARGAEADGSAQAPTRETVGRGVGLGNAMMAASLASPSRPLPGGVSPRTPMMDGVASVSTQPQSASTQMRSKAANAARFDVPQQPREGVVSGSVNIPSHPTTPTVISQQSIQSPIGDGRTEQSTDSLLTRMGSSKVSKFAAPAFASALSFQAAAGDIPLSPRMDSQDSLTRNALIQETGHDLVGLCDKLGCKVTVDVESPTKQYILHLGQVHKTSTIQQTKVFMPSILKSQKHIETILGELSKDGNIAVYNEGMAPEDMIHDPREALMEVKRFVASRKNKTELEIAKTLFTHSFKIDEKTGLSDSLGAYPTTVFNEAAIERAKELKLSDADTSTLLYRNDYSSTVEPEEQSYIYGSVNKQGLAGKILPQPAEKLETHEEAERTMSDAMMARSALVMPILNYAMQDPILKNRIQAEGSVGVIQDFFAATDDVEQLSDIQDVEWRERLQTMDDSNLKGSLKKYFDTNIEFNKKAKFAREKAAVERIMESESFENQKVVPLVYGTKHNFKTAVENYRKYHPEHPIGLITIKLNDTEKNIRESVKKSFAP